MGLINNTTASARKAAVNKVLGILDDSEAADVSVIDIDEVMGRFHNLAGEKYTPESLTAYKSRVKSAIDDFLRYQKDPLNFKPSAQGASKRSVDRQKTAPSAISTRREPPSAPLSEAPPASVNIVPIPIRPDLTIKIQGLPYDLTTQEAAKIANVIKAMATGEG
jgi:hypothetical protein